MQPPRQPGTPRPMVQPRPLARQPPMCDVQLKRGVFLYRLGEHQSHSQFSRPMSIFETSEQHLDGTRDFFRESNIREVISDAMNFGFGQGMMTGFARGKDIGWKDGHAEGSAKYMHLNECLKEHKADDAPCKHPGCIQYFFKYQSDKILLRHTEKRLKAAQEKIAQLESDARAFSAAEITNWTSNASAIVLEDQRAQAHQSEAPTPSPSQTPSSTPKSTNGGINAFIESLPPFTPAYIPGLSPPLPVLSEKKRERDDSEPQETETKKLKVTE